MITISVIISVYINDNPEYFGRALKSIWNDQILKPSEIILVEDGELTKAHHEVINRFKAIAGDVLKIIVNETNLGLTKSLNKAISVASGQYIARMDSDDIAMPQRFKIQSDYLAKHPDVMVLGGGMLEIDENGREGAVRIYPPTSDKIRNYIVKANPIPHPTVMFNSNLFRKGYRYDENFRKNQDLKLWFDLIGQGIVMENLPDVVLKFRRTEETYQKRASKLSIRSEYHIYDHGIRELHGNWSMKRMYPLVRYAVKSMPPWAAKTAYKYLFRKHQK